MNRKIRKSIAVLFFIGIALTFLVVSYVWVENALLVLSDESVEICNRGPDMDDEGKTKIFYEKISGLNLKIALAKFLAKHKSKAGYKLLSDIIKRIEFCGNTEYTFSKVYEALGYLGRLDQRAADILVSEFKPKEDPTRAMEVLRALILSKNMIAISKIKEEALEEGGFLSEGEKAKLLSYEAMSK